MEPLKYDEAGRVVLPQPDEIPERDREHAAGAYVMMFISQYLPLPLMNLVASFIWYMFCRKRSRFVAFHTYQSLISQIPTSVALWGLIVWLVWTLIRLPMSGWGEFFGMRFVIAASVVAVWNLVYVILSLIAYRHARTGRLYYLPGFGRFAYERYFGENALPAIEARPKVLYNTPPGT
jgi:uncharacterized membrane protein